MNNNQENFEHITDQQSQTNRSGGHQEAVKQQQPSHLNQLMSSIQNKLSMLACQDSIQEFEVSKITSPKRQLLTATDQKRRHPRMFVQDLDIPTTSTKQNVQNMHQNMIDNRLKSQNHSNLGQSRVLSRINEIQNFYMEKIQYLSHRISTLQFDYEQLQKKYIELQMTNFQLQQSLKAKQHIENQQLDKKIIQIKNQLIKKFSNQSQTHFQQHLKQMKIITEQLNDEKTKRRRLQYENNLLRTQKTNIQKFYKDLLHDHREMLRLDIEMGNRYNKYQKLQNQNYEKKQKYDNIQILTNSSKNKNNNKNRSQERIYIINDNKGSVISSPEDHHQNNTSSTIKKRKSKKKPSISTNNRYIQKQKDRNNLNDMNKQEMIPYLAKGIQDLKNKLKIK